MQIHTFSASLSALTSSPGQTITEGIMGAGASGMQDKGPCYQFINPKQA